MNIFFSYPYFPIKNSLTLYLKIRFIEFRYNKRENIVWLIWTVLVSSYVVVWELKLKSLPADGHWWHNRMVIKDSVCLRILIKKNTLWCTVWWWHRVYLIAVIRCALNSDDKLYVLDSIDHHGTTDVIKDGADWWHTFD